MNIHILSLLACLSSLRPADTWCIQQDALTYTYGDGTLIDTHDAYTKTIETPITDVIRRQAETS